MTTVKQWLQYPSVKYALIIFIIIRLLLTIWSLVALVINPLPEEPDEAVRPYLGEPILDEGISGFLLGPWQRFDSQRYLAIAREGYADERNSVFPPLYPFTIRALGTILGGGPTANLTAAILLANLACLGFLILLHHVVSQEIGLQYATRTLVYLVLFPTGFFLFAPYTEPIFMLLTLGALWAARNGRFWVAGSLGFLAALTRLTGWILIVPLAYEAWQQKNEERGTRGERVLFALRSSPLASLLRSPAPLLPCFFPPLGLITFLAWRWWAGMPRLSQVYQQYWYQTTHLPGSDIFRSIDTLFLGGPARANEFLSLSLDFAVVIFLFVTTVLVWQRLDHIYGLYAAMMLLFILLPTSELKPIYSFSRYALAFFPSFILLGMVGKRPLLHRLILYPFILLYLYFSGQFFAWGWVA
jgi:hypothetical protein